MIPTVTDPLLFIVGAFLTIGMLWRATRSHENRLWNAIGAAGWATLAISTLADGFVQIGILVVGMGVFLAGIGLRRRTRNSVETV